MTTAEEMHRKWQSGNGDDKLLQSYHPMVISFKQFISKLRNRENIVRTTARILCLLNLNPGLCTTFLTQKFNRLESFMYTCEHL